MAGEGKHCGLEFTQFLICDSGGQSFWSNFDESRNRGINVLFYATMSSPRGWNPETRVSGGFQEAGEAKCPHFESFCDLLIAILKILGMQLFLQ